MMTLRDLRKECTNHTWKDLQLEKGVEVENLNVGQMKFVINER